MPRIVLCDDNPADLQILSGYLEELKTRRSFETVCYPDGPSLLKDYTEQGFCDILVLDMRMQPLDGIEVAKRIRRIDSEVSILIVTATVDYAVDGYKVSASRYIVKPVDKTDFLDSVSRLMDQHIKKAADFFSFSSSSGTTKLLTDHIYYFESYMRSITVCAKEGRFTFTGTISSLEEQLVPHGFIRSHKSFLINVSHIYNIFKDTVTMDNQDILPMSKHKRKDVNREFLNYMETSL